MPATTWKYRNTHTPAGWVYRWRCGEHECFGRAVVDDFGNLVNVS